MLNARLVLVNKLGLHARAAAKFTDLTSKFESNIKVSFSGKTVDGKSIMSVMLLAAAQGSELDVSVDGSDEAEALAALEQLIEERFGEDE